MRRSEFPILIEEIDRASGCIGWIDLDFVERERTPSELIKLGIRLHLAGISLSNTIQELEKFGVERPRKAVHDWVQKADLQPADGASPDHIALDETVIRINRQQFWLYAVLRTARRSDGLHKSSALGNAVDPETNKFLHLELFTTTTTALINAVFLVDYAQHLAAAQQRSRFQSAYLNSTPEAAPTFMSPGVVPPNSVHES